MRLFALSVAVGLVVVLGGVSVEASVKKPAQKASVKKQRCAVMRAHESKRARAARRACRRRAAAAAAAKRKRAPQVVAPPVVGVAPPPIAAGDGPASPPESPGPAPAPVASTLGVGAYDLGSFALRLTRAAVPAGTLTVYFRNHDVSDHNLWIAGPGLASALAISGDVGEGGSATGTLAVGAGSWRLYCSLPGHGSMSAVLAVG